MSVAWQHGLVLALVAACAAYALWQMVRALRAGQGKWGGCCSRGCAGERSKAVGERVVFVPVEMLSRRR